MEKLVATWIRYSPLFNQFFIKADKKNIKDVWSMLMINSYYNIFRKNI